MHNLHAAPDSIFGDHLPSFMLHDAGKVPAAAKAHVSILRARARASLENEADRIVTNRVTLPKRSRRRRMGKIRGLLRALVRHSRIRSR